MINSMRSFATKFVSTNPYLWNLAWKAVNKFHFLLPHDNSYWALKHFCHSDQELFLDIGANTGVSALSFRKINKTASILSLEPNILHAASLSKLKEKIPPFSFLLVGAGDSTKEMDFYTPSFKGIVLHTFTSTSEQQVIQAIEKNFGKKKSNLICMQKTKANIIKLDDLDIKPTIIKVDAEGYDYQVMIGAEKTIRQTRPYIMFEACWNQLNQIKSFLEDLNYQLYSYDCKADCFKDFAEKELNYSLEGKNIFAVPVERTKLLPIR